MTDIITIRKYGELMVRITSDGKVEFGDNVDIDEAARIFWAAVQKSMPKVTHPYAEVALGPEEFVTREQDEDREPRPDVDRFYETRRREMEQAKAQGENHEASIEAVRDEIESVLGVSASHEQVRAILSRCPSPEREMCTTHPERAAMAFTAWCRECYDAERRHGRKAERLKTAAEHVAGTSISKKTLAEHEAMQELRSAIEDWDGMPNR